MKKFIIPTILIFSLFLADQLLSSSLLKQVEKGSRSYESNQKKSSLMKQVDSGSRSNEEEKEEKEEKETKSISKPKLSKNAKYSIEDVARILRSKNIADFALDHDDHVYKCIKISNHARDLEGAVGAIAEFDTEFGDTVDMDEVDLIIRISKVDTQVYQEIAILAKRIGKTETTVNEHYNIVREFEKGNGIHLREGIERSRACSYNIENDYFSPTRLELLVNIGKLKDPERFFDIYSAMRRVGMSKKINSISLEILYKMHLVKGDVPGKIKEFLFENKWKSRKQPGNREYYVVRDMMYANEKPYPMLNYEDKKKKTKKKKIRKVKRKKRVEKKKKKKKKGFFEKLLGDPCSEVLKK